MKKGLMTGMLIAYLFYGSKLYGQEQTLDPVTVTSSLTEKRTSETGRNIIIIQGDDIAKLPVHSLDELLKYMPGVEVQSRGPQGSQSDISMRGGTFQQVLVILDGLRINDPNTGHFSAYIPVTPAQIERIEVLKGASAAIYGSDAVGGVINIITKSAAGNPQQEKKSLNAQVLAGEYQLFNTAVDGLLQIGKLTADLGVMSNHSDGVWQRGSRGYFHNSSASIGLRYQLNNHLNISFRSAYDNRDFAAQNFYTTFASDTATEKVRSWWHQAQLSYQKNKSRLSLNAGYKNLNDAYLFNSVSTANENISGLFQTLVLYQYSLGQKAQMNAGLNYQHRTIRSNDRGNHSLSTAAPFVSYSQQIGSYFTVWPSVRVEWLGNHGAEMLPQLNSSFHKGNFQIRASGGRTIRDADFTERYNNNNKEMVASGSIGNPGLIPEVAWTYEAGFDWFYRSAFRFSSTFFQRFHRRLIDWVTTPYEDMPVKDHLATDGIFALAKNIAEVNTTGWETDLQYIGRWNDHQKLILNTGILWLYSHSSEANAAFYISSHARFLSNFNLQYEWGPAAFSFTGIYKSREPRQSSAIHASISKDYFVMNGRASYSFPSNKMQVFVQLDNVFDRTYSDLLGAVMPGRWVQGGLRYKLF